VTFLHRKLAPYVQMGRARPVAGHLFELLPTFSDFITIAWGRRSKTIQKID
jgi:hypothetical protein